MGKRDKKKKDPQKKALQRAQKEAKQDKKAAKKLAKEQRKESTRADGGEAGGGENNDFDDLDAILDSYKKRNNELTTPVIQVLGEGDAADGGLGVSKFPSPPRGNFTLTAIPSGELYLFGGEFYDGAENLVFDTLYRWDPDARGGDDDNEDDTAASKGGGGGIGDVVNDVLLMNIGDDEGSASAKKATDSGSSNKSNQPNPGVW